jgi:hypothetical protein
MVNSGLKWYKRRRDLCHFTQSLPKLPRNDVSHSFDPHHSTLHGMLIPDMPTALLHYAYLNAFKDKLTIPPL